MTRRPAWLTGVVVSAVALLALVGGRIGPDVAPPQVPQATTLPLTGAVQVCPGAQGVAAASAEVVAVSLADTGASEEADGALALRTLPGADVVPRLLGSTETRGETVTAPARPALAVRGEGALAPGVVAQSVLAAARARTTGLASVTCPEPARDVWFVAGSGQVGERATVVIGNPFDAPAVVDVTVWSETGPLPAAGTQDLGIPPQGTRQVSIDAVALGARRTAVHVDVSLGRVGATMVLREVSGADPQGVSWVSASAPPTRRAHVPGVPAAGERTLRLLTPGETDAIVSVRALTPSGPFTPVGLEAIDAPSGEVVDVDLGRLDDQVATLEVVSSEPVVSAVTVRQTADSGLSDLAVVGSVGTLDTVGATWVDAADGRSSQLLVTAVADETPSAPEPPAPSPSASEDAAGGASPSASESATPAAEPSPEPTAAGDTPEPSESADASPGPTTDGQQPADTDDSTTQVVVRVLDPDGSTSTATVVTVPTGATVEVPVDLDDGLAGAWLVLDPVEAGTVVAARETTATISVPDPLAADTDRDGLWLDLVPIVGSTLTVVSPPVLADVTAGLPRQSSSSP